MLKRVWVWGLLVATALSCSFSHGCVDESNFLTTGGVQVKTFIVFDSQRQPLWKLSSTSALEVKKVLYGVVPAGFVQEVPAPGDRPRSLIAGEKIVWS